ncbi:MAG: response regulator, partial [Scytonema sp. PMC 1070.18]|nr:response regulator [Scytonema sp. PMC 1070.18]
VGCGESTIPNNASLTRWENPPTQLAPLPPTPSTPRILLVEDNADMRDYVKRLLERRYEVEVVADGLEALAFACDRPPDLVLSDVMMPGLDGFGLLRELRVQEKTKEVPVILLSARAGEEAKVEGLEAGADDYLIKPFSARELLARVEANLKMAQLRQQTKQWERELRIEAETAKENLEVILSSISDAFVVYDADWRYVYVNVRAEELSGLRKDDLLGKKLWEVFPDLVGTQFYTELNRAVALQQVVQFEYFYPVWNRWFENRVYPSASGISMFSTDITSRKQAEEARCESEEKFRLLAESAPVLIWIDNAEGKCEFVNKAYLDFFGKSLEEVLGFGWCASIHPEDEEPYVSVFLEALKERKPFRAQLRVKRSDGEYRWLESYALPRLSSSGEFLGYVGTSPDITEIKETEAVLEQSLARERIAREEAEVANRIKDEFLAVLSHELRSPLNPILGWSQLLQSRKFDEEAMSAALKTIERNAKLQTQLIDDLLDVSRILQGKMKLNICPVNLVTTIEAALETVQLAAEAKNIHIQTILEPRIEGVLGDTNRLQQVIWNLLSNAVKFTPAGGQIEVRLQQVGTDAQIQVKDTGIGITPDFLPHVFDNFRQADGKTTRRFGGLGLGLAIVRHLTELHGGVVHAESPGEGMGATFTVTLPLRKRPESKVLNEEASPHNSTPLKSGDTPLSGLQILVVDDEADMLNLATVILLQSGATVRTAISAIKALDILDKWQPDVLISDIGMPDIDGYTLMRQVRSRNSEQGGEIPAIALTAYTGEFNQQQAITAGFQHHITKPVEPDELVKAIAKIYFERSAHRVSAKS